MACILLVTEAAAIIVWAGDEAIYFPKPISIGSGLSVCRVVPSPDQFKF